MLALHLLQICRVYINTLIIQPVLTEPDRTQRMLSEDLRALTPLGLIVGQKTCFGISWALGTSVSRGDRRNALAEVFERFSKKRLNHQ